MSLIHFFFLMFVCYFVCNVKCWSTFLFWKKNSKKKCPRKMYRASLRKKGKFSKISKNFPAREAIQWACAQWQRDKWIERKTEKRKFHRIKAIAAPGVWWTRRVILLFVSVEYVGRWWKKNTKKKFEFKQTKNKLQRLRKSTNNNRPRRSYDCTDTLLTHAYNYTE